MRTHKTKGYWTRKRIIGVPIFITVAILLIIAGILGHDGGGERLLDLVGWMLVGMLAYDIIERIVQNAKRPPGR